MFERFSDRARQAVVLAQEEARQLGHDHIGTEHVLLGLLREREGIAAKALQRFGIGLAEARTDVEALVGRGSVTPVGHIPFTPRSKKVLELGLREAMQLGHNYIGTEHILLGLVREADGVGARVLAGRGAELGKVRAAVLEQVNKVGAERERAAPRRTPAADDVLAEAQRLAGSGPLGSHHLLEALARSDDSLAGKVLGELGVDVDVLAAKIDELGPVGTNDLTPEEEAARRIVITVDGDAVHVVLSDEESLAAARAVVDALGGPIRGDDAAVGSLVGLRRDLIGALDDLRQRVTPPAEDSSLPTRQGIVSRAVRSRLARRREG